MSISSDPNSILFSNTFRNLVDFLYIGGQIKFGMHFHCMRYYEIYQIDQNLACAWDTNKTYSN